MDIAPSNGLADPHGGSEQGAYPWRARITCDPAPGRDGTPDATSACAEQVARFVGTATPNDFSVDGTSIRYGGPEAWGYRRMILHYAHLCAAAGGVEAFLIGSELCGLTTLRDAEGSYPFVDALVQLAAEVKAILPDAKVSYAADWTEYACHRPDNGTNGLYFHLDPLWASPSIDFIGIDNYMPLADWRDGEVHADRLAGVRSPYDPAYLRANVAGGEGFDWYYASDAARAAQARTPIADAAYGKPWVFRTKDLAGWWSNPHVNRPGGTEQGSATAWIPESKPIWFTEVGCAAIDKGANQPNAFTDPKSSEDLRPYFSSGARDDLMQHSALLALQAEWSETGRHNPVSSVYGAPMLDAARIFHWAWDARPYPWFPANESTWADGSNYACGHWLNGRIAAVPLGRLIASVCAAHGMADVDVSDVEGLVDGFVIDRAMTARDALEGLLSAFGVDAVESDGRLRFRMRRRAAGTAVSRDDLVETEPEAELLEITRAQETELPAALRLAYVESGVDYRTAVVESRRLGGQSSAETSLPMACAIEQAVAQQVADVALQEAWAGRDRLACGLGLRWIGLEPGDVMFLECQDAYRTFRIDETGDGSFRKIRGRSFDSGVYRSGKAPARKASPAVAQIHGEPDALVMELPIASDSVESHAPWFAVSAGPWPGTIAAYRRTGTDRFTLNRTVTAQATKGVLVEPLTAGPLHVLDRTTRIAVTLESGALSSVSEAELLDGENIVAVGDETLGWEILQFATAELTGPDTYRLAMLLRGQAGSAPEMLAERPAGSRFVLLNAAVVQPQLALSEAGLPVTWRFGPAQYDVSRGHVSVTQQGQMLGLRPLSPCHAAARQENGDIVLAWLRRTRSDGDSWDLEEVPLGEESEAYVVQIRDGEEVKREVEVSSPFYRYPAADIAADFGAMPSRLTVRICQLSAAFGRGAFLERTLDV